jgi:hypothetical protein
MAGPRVTKTSVEDEQRALAQVAAEPRTVAARAALITALESKRAPVVARAAKLIQEHAIADLEAEMSVAIERFLRDPARSDPNCHARLALLDALDHAESQDAEPFLRALRTAAPESPLVTGSMRSRCALALARIGHTDLPVVAGQLLADPQASVRHAALDALAHRGDPAGAGLAMFKLRAGDDDRLVTLAAASALLALAPTWALHELRTHLERGTDSQQQLAAMALGQSRRDEALTLLLEALDRTAIAEDRAPLLTGIGMHRSDRALEAMIAVIRGRGESEARQAIQALAPRRFESGIEARVRAAARDNEDADLRELLDEVF